MGKHCRFCKKGKIKLLFSANKGNGDEVKNFACTNSAFGRHGPIVKCEDCLLIYLDEDTPQKTITTYYQVVEDPVYFEEQGARQKTFEKYLVNLEKIFPKKGKLLDIGTNTGLFVKLARDSGWDAIGLEPNRWAVEYAKKEFGLKLINKPFEENTFKKESFDVVTMWDVIEHFTNPAEEVKKVYKFLKHNGVFAFSTVDPESPFAKMFGTRWSWYMEMHRVFWTRSAARSELGKIGFKKIIFKPHFRFLSMGYLSTRTEAVHPIISNSLTKITNLLHIGKFIVPYYANDLYDCYAFKN